MTIHPLLMGTVLLDLLGVLLMSAAGWKSYAIIAGWNPDSADSRQLRLERSVEVAALQTAWAQGFVGCSTLLFVLTISNVLPSVIPGAMCGTGAMAATNSLGYQALWLHVLAFAMLYWQGVISRLNQSAPVAVLTPLAARTALAALPVVFLSFFYSLRVCTELDVQGAVDCCAVIYDGARNGPSELETGTGGAKFWWLGVFGVGGIILCGWGVSSAVSPRPHDPRLKKIIAAAALCWVPLALFCLIRYLCVYFYQVLSHHCPWCLLLPEHHYIGLPLYGLLLLVVLESPVIVLTAHIAARYVGFTDVSMRRYRRAGWALAVGTGGFLLLTALPALWWRWQFGVWIR